MTEEKMRSLLAASPDDYWKKIVFQVEAACKDGQCALLLNHQAAHLLAWATIARDAFLSTKQDAEGAAPTDIEYAKRVLRDLAQAPGADSGMAILVEQFDLMCAQNGRLRDALREARMQNDSLYRKAYPKQDAPSRIIAHKSHADLPGTWRARKIRYGSHALEVELPCINGLSAWFTVATFHEAGEEERLITDGARQEAGEYAAKFAALSQSEKHHKLRTSNKQDAEGEIEAAAQRIQQAYNTECGECGSRLDLTDALILALAALSQEGLVAGGDGWRDIASAPKDGTSVLGAWAVNGHREWREVVWWEGDGWCGQASGYWQAKNWPTHWQPLPAPPVAGADGKGDGK